MGAWQVSRTARVAADPARVHALVDDLHAWRQWSPWEDIDPDMERTYSGPASGPGAAYAWKGDRKAGEGSMLVTSSSPERVELTVSFVKPFRATNDVVFDLSPVADGTQVTWSMRGETTGLMALVGRVYPMERLIGKDFDRGLARLKAAAEA